MHDVTFISDSALARTVVSSHKQSNFEVPNKKTHYKEFVFTASREQTFHPTPLVPMEFGLRTEGSGPGPKIHRPTGTDGVTSPVRVTLVPVSIAN